MDGASQSPQRPLDVDQLRAAYPEWAIGRVVGDHRDPPRWEAVARSRDVRPSCVITADLDELARELAAAADSA